jgi:hypothetical protein
MRVTLAMLFYFGSVFGVGFLLGPMRVLWLEPRFGPFIATACEAPFLLMAMLVAARWVPCVFNIRRDPKTLVLVGIGSLALLQIADFTVGFWLRSITPTEQFAQLPTEQRKHLRCLPGIVCNNAMGCQLGWCGSSSMVMSAQVNWDSWAEPLLTGVTCRFTAGRHCPSRAIRRPQASNPALGSFHERPNMSNIDH